MHVYTDFHGYLGYTYLEHTTTRRTGLTFPLRSPPSHFSKTYFLNLDTCSYLSIKKLHGHLARETILDRRSCSSAHPEQMVTRSFTEFSVIKNHRVRGQERTQAARRPTSGRKSHEPDKNCFKRDFWGQTQSVAGQGGTCEEMES